MFINYGENEALYSMKAIKKLRSLGIKVELYPDKAKVAKQMQHADKRFIPFVVIVGEDEIANNIYSLKNLVSGEQKKVSLEELITLLG